MSSNFVNVNPDTSLLLVAKWTITGTTPGGALLHLNKIYKKDYGKKKKLKNHFIKQKEDGQLRG